MSTLIKIAAVLPVLAGLLLFVAPVHAAVPDGAGPWADSVLSSSQGLMKNGLPVPAPRSDPTTALGVAETDLVDTHFFSLGFGGNVSLGFDNGISSGVIVFESTYPGYAGEAARIELSEDGVTWVQGGTIVQDGTVAKPEGMNCVRFVRITDISNLADFSDATADGYDVDGVRASGETCTSPPSPTPTATPTPPSGDSGGSSVTTTTTVSAPAACTSPGVTTVPTIILARRTSPTSILVNWGPDAGLHDFIVHYGFTDGNWQFNTKVSGFSTTINDLPPNQSIWIQVAATDNCAVGAFGRSVLVGGTSLTNSPGFPNTGNPLIPGLPNTGVDPNMPWNVQVGQFFHAIFNYITGREN